MRKLLLLACALAVLGAVGCSGSAGKDENGTNAPNAATPKSTEQGKAAEEPKSIDPSKPAEGPKVSDLGKGAEVPLKDAGKAQTGTSTANSEPASKGKDAKQPTVGQKGAAYLGTYGVVITPEMKKLAQSQIDAMLARIPEKERAKARAQAQSMMDMASKLELVLEPGGKYQISGFMGSGPASGTYTVQGNTLEMKAPAKDGTPNPKTQKLTFDPKTQTLTGVGGNGQKTVFKKK